MQALRWLSNKDMILFFIVGLCPLWDIYYICIANQLRLLAPVAELADALDLGSSVSRRAGSIPVRRTWLIEGEISPFFYNILKVLLSLQKEK